MKECVTQAICKLSQNTLSGNIWVTGTAHFIFNLMHNKSLYKALYLYPARFLRWMVKYKLKRIPVKCAQNN